MLGFLKFVSRLFFYQSTVRFYSIDEDGRIEKYPYAARYLTSGFRVQINNFSRHRCQGLKSGDLGQIQYKHIVVGCVIICVACVGLFVLTSDSLPTTD